jgi:hypothetical protein
LGFSQYWNGINKFGLLPSEPLVMSLHSHPLYNLQSSPNVRMASLTFIANLHLTHRLHLERAHPNWIDLSTPTFMEYLAPVEDAYPAWSVEPKPKDASLNLTFFSRGIQWETKCVFVFLFRLKLEMEIQ